MVTKVTWTLLLRFDRKGRKLKGLGVELRAEHTAEFVSLPGRAGQAPHAHSLPPSLPAVK